MHIETFQTLADPTRLRIIETLRGGARSVNEIVDQVDIHQSGVSRHLRILEQAGFVHARAEGAHRIYALRGERFRELDVWIERYRGVWEARLDRFGAALQSRTQARKRKDKPS